jgi:hypothetical protein
LAKNIGRLSEGPSESEIIGPIFTNAQSLYAIFSMTGHDSVKLPNENVISDVKLRVGRLVEFIKMNRIEEATETFHELKELSISSRDTTATTMELARAIGQQPKDEKQLVVNFLLGEESGLFANSVTQLVQTYFR